ncbi:hypothetical protein AB0D83_34605 [Streptomyces decoyicus]|uniref:hypothetical protein n=1 Tax=Streptomyces decoyicus TaxID=249567 RepID=UPI0033DE6B02
MNFFKRLFGFISGKPKGPDWIQVDLSVWEDMAAEKSPAAFFRNTPTEPPFNGLTFGFPEDEDNFGFAIVRLRSGALIALIADPGSPVPGTGLYGSGIFNGDDLTQEVRDAFHLKETDVIWVTGQSMET